MAVPAKKVNKQAAMTYTGLVGAFVLFALVGGYLAATTSGSWQTPFSWHPFLMTCGMISMMGVGALTKKLGGYENTKVR